MWPFTKKEKTPEYQYKKIYIIFQNIDNEFLEPIVLKSDYSSAMLLYEDMVNEKIVKPLYNTYSNMPEDFIKNKYDKLILMDGDAQADNCQERGVRMLFMTFYQKCKDNDTLYTFMSAYDDSEDYKIDTVYVSKDVISVSAYLKRMVIKYNGLLALSFQMRRITLSDDMLISNEMAKDAIIKEEPINIDVKDHNNPAFNAHYSCCVKTFKV